MTVICADNTAADAYSTAFFVMSKEKTSGFLENHPEIKVILVTADGEIIRIN